jgi:hypothetical protein
MLLPVPAASFVRSGLGLGGLHGRLNGARAAVARAGAHHARPREGGFASCAVRTEASQGEGRFRAFYGPAAGRTTRYLAVFCHVAHPMCMRCAAAAPGRGARACPGQEQHGATAGPTATPELFCTLLGALQYQAIAYKATERPARHGRPAPHTHTHPRTHANRLGAQAREVRRAHRGRRGVHSRRVARRREARETAPRPRRSEAEPPAMYFDSIGPRANPCGSRRAVRPRLMRRAWQPPESLRRRLRMHGAAAACFSQAVHARGVHAHAAVSGAFPPSAGLPLAARRTGRRRRRRDRPFAATVARR